MAATDAYDAWRWARNPGTVLEVAQRFKGKGEEEEWFDERVLRRRGLRKNVEQQGFKPGICRRRMMGVVPNGRVASDR